MFGSCEFSLLVRELYVFAVGPIRLPISPWFLQEHAREAFVSRSKVLMFKRACFAVAEVDSIHSLDSETVSRWFRCRFP